MAAIIRAKRLERRERSQLTADSCVQLVELNADPVVLAAGPDRPGDSKRKAVQLEDNFNRLIPAGWSSFERDQAPFLAQVDDFSVVRGPALQHDLSSYGADEAEIPAFSVHVAHEASSGEHAEHDSSPSYRRIHDNLRADRGWIKARYETAEMKKGGDPGPRL